MDPVNIYLIRINNRNTEKGEICSKIIIKTLERQQQCRSGVFIVNFENILNTFLVFPLLNLNRQMFPGEGINILESWDYLYRFSKTRKGAL